MTPTIVITGTALAGVAAGWFASGYRQRRWERRFSHDYDELVRTTDVAWNELAGPGPEHPAAAEFADRTESAQDLARSARPLSASDYTYYVQGWGNVRGEFATSPRSGLLLAQHLTANLLLNRGLLPRDTKVARRLPEYWRFPTADGFRRARRLAERDGRLTGREELEALTLFEDFYLEILTLSFAHGSV